MKRSLAQMSVPRGMGRVEKPPLPKLTDRGFYDAAELLTYLAAAKRVGMHMAEMAVHLRVPLDELSFWTRQDRVERLAKIATQRGNTR